MQSVLSSPRSPWLMLLVLTTGFALSQAFRTVAALMAPPLQQAFGLSPQQLGLFAGVFHFAFGALQLFMGMGIDVFGVRRTVLAVFPLAIVGALLTASATSYGWLLVGQALTGIGCAPAFLVCTVFIARQFPPDRFASVSGATLGIGSAGLLLTGTPLAWIIEGWSWRAGFLALAACATVAWLAIWLLVREQAPDAVAERPGVWAALRGYGELFRLPHTLGIIGLAVFTYASFLSLRGLWLGPLLIDRYGFSLVQTGNAALAVSLVGMLGPPLFGRLDPGDARRRRWIIGFTLLVAGIFALMALRLGAAVEVGLAVAIGLISGYMVMQYADVKAAYPARMTGRAMAVFTMAMFLGVALMQWLTGLVASAAGAMNVEPYAAVLASIAGFLVLGAAAFRWLPAPAKPLER
ncbi:MFS transporter [Caenimonas sedimenti]|uniref:MFS transporter n=1 Tax=Caenimonas sedimenti TaxID=2596921 RepID=A0A562ZR79_9BURK|nr:MFS transporter [Caenimonas sedimenti]TWO70887.1 MFS transporter [Caenimonas sedimenti]